MERDITEILSDPALDCLSRAEKDAFAALYYDIRGKTAREAVGIFLSRKESLVNGSPMTDAKRTAITEVLKNSLSPAERADLEKMMILFQTMRRG